jgi:Leucine-rich repeat (LRR) protein
MYWVVTAVLFWYLSQPAIADGVYNVPESEIAALQDLYDATNGDFWNWEGPGNIWNFTNPNPCYDFWQGVNCSLVAANGFLHVIELSLCEYGLEGTIPASVAQLTQLATLRLSSNKLNGTIPDSVGQLSMLTYLYLDVNRLSRTLPASLGQLKQLQELDLGTNLLLSSIPEALQQLKQLTLLFANNNVLYGTIPAFVGQLTQLTALDLHSNMLVGTIPDSFCQLTRLTALYLSVNELTGTIPAFLGQFTQLTALDLGDNYLARTIPDALQQLTQLSRLYLDHNLLTGTIPTALCKLWHLEHLWLYHNLLTGRIPDSLLQQLPQLGLLYLYDNFLSGTVPASLSQLSQLTAINLQNNLLSGTIPGTFHQLGQLSQLFLDTNQLTGTIPDALATLALLTVLQLGANHLTGAIPNSLSELAMLDVLYVQGNRLSGTIPPSLGQLARLRALFLGSNHLQGPIPQNWSAAANVIQVLHLQENHCSGSIPGFLGHLPQLMSLDLSSNGFTGTIPASFQLLGCLQVLILGNNQLRGNITYLFSPAQQANLSTVQLSNNQLTGALPAAAFLLPSLSSFAAVDNCFDCPLPEETICSSTSLSALVLDGLHSAASCKRSALLSHEAFKLGALPQCLLSMPSLATLHLSGNGLTGSLPAEVNVSTALTDLSLSHNSLTGDIPRSILGKDWGKLDASYNRFRGTLHSSSCTPHSDATHLYLQHNRLSGVVPGSMQSVGTLFLLENNLFSCRVDRSDVPQQDPDSDKYTCGSDAASNSLYAWLGAVAITVVSGATVICGQKTQAVYNWFFTVREAKLSQLQDLIGARNMLLRLGAGSAAYCILVLLPVYAAINSYYPSFTYKYAWTVSGVFLTGTAAFAAEAVFLLLQLPICAYVAEWLLSCSEPQALYKKAGATTSVDRSDKVYAPLTVAKVAVVLFSLGVVTSINVAFVMATLHLNDRELTAIQVLLAVFKLGFNSIAAPALQNRVRALGVEHEVTALQLLLVLLNVIVIPCVVIMFISPSCFYDALKGTDPVTSSYNYGGSCLEFYYQVDETTGKVAFGCIEATGEVETTTYTPPFTYSYQCSSSFITSYAPTFVTMCIISSFVLPAYHLLLLWLRRHLSPTSRRYAVVTAATPRILRELPSPQDLSQARSDPLYRPVFDANKLVMSLLTYLALLLSFGALFPPLAVCCAVAMASVALTARLEVGRYVRAAMAADRQDCLDEVESACAGVATPQQLRIVLYLVLTVSCMFYTLFLFDTLGYEVGFAGAFWVLIVVPLLPVVAWALHTAVVRVCDRGPMTEVNKTAHDNDPEVGVELASMQTASGKAAGADLVTDSAHYKTGSVGTVSVNPMHML